MRNGVVTESTVRIRVEESLEGESVLDVVSIRKKKKGKKTKGKIKKICNKKVCTSIMILSRQSKTCGWHLANGLTLCSFFTLERTVYLTSCKVSTLRTSNGQAFRVNLITYKLHLLFDSISIIYLKLRHQIYLQPLICMYPHLGVSIALWVPPQEFC